jgi:thiol-disulfide isomerase/thioredoxin
MAGAGEDNMQLVALVALLCFGVQAAQLPDAEALMKQVDEAYRGFTTLQYEEERTSERLAEASQGHSPIKTTTVLAVAKPGKRRSETNFQGLRIIDGSDGETMWVYEPVHNEYTITNASALAAEAPRSNSPPGPKPNISRKTLREETIEIDGQRYDCWVVETRMSEVPGRRPPSAVQVKMTDVVTTDWIDKKLLIRRQSTITSKQQVPDRPEFQILQKTVYRNVKINEAIPDSVFTFVPPPDARKVQSIRVRPMPMDLVGTQAPDFHVKGLDEKQYDLASFKGKPVLLDFWASWCGPCRTSLPALEKIYKEYKDQGLVILAVNATESRPIVESFLKKTPLAYPAVLSAGDSGIREQYHVGAIPVFVLIGPDGRIAAHQVGFGGEDDIRLMLSKIGLKGPIKGQ